MANYKYSGMNELGRKISGTIIAENEVDLEERLKQVGLELLDYKELKEKKGRGGRVKLQDMILFCLHMEQLIKAGVPLLDSIADVRDSTESARLKDVMTSVYESVKGGENFSQALSKHPTVFGEVFVGLIAAGEKTGDFSGSFTHLSEHMKWTNDIHRKVKKAMGYPIALLLVMSGVITVLMIFVVPKLIDFITSQGFDIPIHTRALIVVSHGFVEYWYVIFGIPIAIIIALIAFYKASEKFAYSFDGFMLKIPVIGMVIRKINMARFTHFFAVMFNSGIDILEALSSAKNVVGNRVLKESIINAARTVSEGTSLTSAMRMTNQFPNLVIRMFKVGEDSGNMHDALENVNFFYNREVNDAVDTLVGLVQPALTIVMGGLIFWVIAAVFGPLYQSFSKMKF
jgi:type IV pilus assembly protein PilC